MNTKYFDIKRDLRITVKGGFMCNGCLVAKPLSEQSPKDARYCMDCQLIIEYEYALAAEHRGHKSGYKPIHPEAILEVIESQPKEIDTGEEETKMSTSNQEELELPQSGQIQPTARQKTYKKRELPVEQIRQSHDEGMGSKAIASKLKRQGIVVSYKTIQRVLSGERSQHYYA